jgi:hypothetical protein
MVVEEDLIAPKPESTFTIESGHMKVSTIYYASILHKPFTAKDHTTDETFSAPLLPRRSPLPSKSLLSEISRKVVASLALQRFCYNEAQ